MTALLLEDKSQPSVIDALPYIDPLDEEAKSLAEKFIDEECARMRSEGRTPDQYISHLPPMSSYMRFKNSTLMPNEVKRIEGGQTKMPPLDETRFSIEPPRLHDQQDPQAWKKSATNAAAQLEHQYHRIENLKLGVKFGPFVWKAHNARTDVYLKAAEKRTKEVEAEITKVNQRRKLHQEQAKVTLDRLSKTYRELVQKNIEIQVACENLEAKIAEQNVEEASMDGDKTKENKEDQPVTSDQ